MVLSLLSRLLLAGVFVVSAAAKLRDRTGSRDAVKDFGVPSPLVKPIAAILPFVELTCAALLLLPDPWATVGTLASMSLLAACTTAITANLLLGRKPDCHCFGQLSGGPTGWATVGRNAALIVIAVVPLFRAADLQSVPDALEAYTGAQVAVGAILAALIAAVIALTLFSRALMTRYGSVLLRLEALEEGAPVQFRPAPDLELPDLDGQMIRLDDLLERQRPVLLAFISPTCSICGELLPELEEWQARADVTVAVVSDGSVQANRTKVVDTPLLSVLVQKDREAAEAYGVSGTPAAFLVGTDGLIAGQPAYGIGAIRDLYDATLRAVAPDEPSLHKIGRRPVGIGDPVPDVPVTVDGQPEPVSARTLADGEKVLLFWSTGCGFCSAITDDVAALETDATIALVTSSSTDEIRKSGLTSRIARDPDAALQAALQVPGTPSAVRVRDGVIASDVAVGGPEVLSLLRKSDHSL